MFKRAISSIRLLEPSLRPGWVYRCEYLQKPKHNALAYDRVPNMHLVLLDVMVGLEEYASYEIKVEAAKRLGLEVVPLMYQGVLEDIETLQKLLDTVSFLGGQKIEGVVVKNYNRFDKDGKVLMGKYVSDAFKEVHRKSWKADNLDSKDIISLIADKYRNEARWNKAVQHLQEAGTFKGSLHDIGSLMKEIKQDVETECADEIKDMLWKWARKDVLSRVSSGIPEWWKEKLLDKQFTTDLKEGSNE